MKNMKKMKLYAVISPLCILFAQSALTVQAQKIDDSQLRLAGGKILIDSVLTQKKSDSLKVAFRLHLDSLQLKSEQQLVFTPLIAGEDTIALNPIIINGKNQNIRYLRKSSKLKNSQAVVVRRRNDTEQQVLFSQTLPYRKWMKAFNLSMTEDLCGCGNLMDQDTTQMAVINPIPKIGRVHYVKPKAEAIKVRAEKGEAYLSFKLNKSDILADFRENATELRKITSTIDLVKNDKDVSITNIDIHGYASPDGPYDNNVRLANNRAAALRNYVCNLYTIDKKLFTYHATPEDWEGFKKKVEASHLPIHVQALQ
jgi:outer membrane protein OmpA-like peptidoglycan-associated protein